MLGTHVCKISKMLDPPNKVRKTMHESIQVECEVLGLNAAQIFTHGPRGYNRNPMDYEKLKKLSEEYHLSVHSSYPTVAIWKVTRKNKNEANSKKILEHVKDQLLSCRQIGADGLVIHISRHPVDHLLETMKVLEPIIKDIGVPVWLEMISSKAHPELTYESPKKLNRLVKTLKEIDPQVWGLCIDTAHVYGSGLDISTIKQQDSWFNELTKEASKKISLFHLNGTESILGSGSDKHAIAFCTDDNIYRKYKNTPKKSGLYSVVKFCDKHIIPIILEINRGSEKGTIDLINIIATIESV
jgi:endonuclease IV